jgi:hypothetical protein
MLIQKVESIRKANTRVGYRVSFCSAKIEPIGAGIRSVDSRMPGNTREAMITTFGISEAKVGTV